MWGRVDLQTVCKGSGADCSPGSLGRVVKRRKQQNADVLVLCCAVNITLFSLIFLRIREECLYPPWSWWEVWRCGSRVHGTVGHSSGEALQGPRGVPSFETGLVPPCSSCFPGCGDPCGPALTSDQRWIGVLAWRTCPVAR